MSAGSSGHSAFWDASIGYDASVWVDAKGNYETYEGGTTVNTASPRPAGQRRRYVAFTGEVFKRVSPTRWNIYRRDRLVAFTRGRDGVAAALAFVTFKDGILPD